MKKILAIVALGLMSSPAAAADLGGRSYKDSPMETAGPGVSVSWTGLYIGAGLGHNSTSHDVKGQQDYSSAQTLTDVYSHVDADGNTIYNGDKCATGEKGCGMIAPAGTHVPAGEAGDAVLKDYPSLVGYAVDSTEYFSQSPTGKGWAPSLTIGYDKQMGSMLFGVMADYQFRSAKTDFGNGLSVSQSDAFFLGARAGFLPTQRVLVYGLAGYTWLSHSGMADDLRAVDVINDAAYTKHDASYGDGSFGGFTVGAGVETIVANNVRIGLEARQTWYGKETVLNSTFTDPIAHNRVSTSVTDEMSELTVMGTIKFNLTGDSSPFK